MSQKKTGFTDNTQSWQWASVLNSVSLFTAWLPLEYICTYITIFIHMYERTYLRSDRKETEEYKRITVWLSIFVHWKRLPFPPSTRWFHLMLRPAVFNFSPFYFFHVTFLTISGHPRQTDMYINLYIYIYTHKIYIRIFVSLKLKANQKRKQFCFYFAFCYCYSFIFITLGPS